jgi:tRNA (adenine37-N6)-methyltransferase
MTLTGNSNSRVRDSRFWCFLLAAAFLFGFAEESMGGDYTVKAIGSVVKRSGRTALQILPEYRDALSGLTGFSHVIVFYWFDKNDTPEKRATLKVHPRRDKSNPLTGVFATRSPFRPNPIAFSVCKIRSVEDCTIVIDGIDAFAGSPIVDLKPYIPRSDCVAGATVPVWVKSGPGSAEP